MHFYFFLSFFLHIFTFLSLFCSYSNSYLNCSIRIIQFTYLHLPMNVFFGSFRTNICKFHAILHRTFTQFMSHRHNTKGRQKLLFKYSSRRPFIKLHLNNFRSFCIQHHLMKSQSSLMTIFQQINFLPMGLKHFSIF